MTEPSIDRERLDSITGGDPALREELLTLFFSTVDRCLRALEKEQNAVQDEAWRAAVHELKGAGGNLGCWEVQDLCGRAEESRADSGEARQKQIQDIRLATEKVRRFYGVS